MMATMRLERWTMWKLACGVLSGALAALAPGDAMAQAYETPTTAPIDVDAGGAAR